MQEFSVAHEKQAATLSCAFSPDNKQLVAGNYKGGIVIHNTSNGEELYRLNNAHTTREVRDIKYFQHGSGFVSCSEGQSENLKVWGSSLEPIQSLEFHTRSVYAVAISPCSLHIVSGGREAECIVWTKLGDTWTGIKSIRDHTSHVLTVCFSPNGKILATSGFDKHIMLYHFYKLGPDNSDEVEEILYVDQYFALRNDSVINSLAFSPDSAYLCSGSIDSSLRVWSPKYGLCFKTVESCMMRDEMISCVEYSPNGRIILTSGRDRTLRLWDSKSLNELHVFESHLYGWFVKATFSNDSNFIASANWDEHMRIMSCRDWSKTSLSVILDLIIFIIYRKKISNVTYPRVWFWTRQSQIYRTMKRLGELVAGGDYDVTGEILSFLARDGKCWITPNRWKPKNIK